jgi:glycosyltransferase involved in cell wall biosynthesis
VPPSDDATEAAPLVTVCMPASRSGEDLRRALRSVLDQGVERLEVIVSDDSGGRLRSVAEELGDPRVRYRANPEPLGFAGNHMAALDEARGEFVGILHEDDTYLPQFLEAALGRFAEDESLGVVMADCWVERDGVRRRRGVRLRAGRHANFLTAAVRHDYFLPSTTVLRRRVLQDARRWPDGSASDLFLFIDAARAGWPFFYLDEPLVVYREHSGQISSDDLGLRNSLVDVFGAYRFDDPEAEDLRRYRLAWALVSRAGMHLRRVEPRQARADLRRARATHPSTLRWKRLGLHAASHGAWLAPRVHPLWTRLRNRLGVARRHQYRH